VTTTALSISSIGPEPAGRPPSIYVGIDVGYRTHVAAACSLQDFNPQRGRDAWRGVRTLQFTADAAGFAHLRRYLERLSRDPVDFLVLLEPTGGYYGLALTVYLLSKGYRVLQVENRAVKDYREKVFGSETKNDVVDARLMARMGFLHTVVGEEFSIQPVQLVDADSAELRVMVGDLTKVTKEISRRLNQLQQIAAATFPEFKTFFKDSTASRAARAILVRFPTPQDLADADDQEIADVLRSVSAYTHAKRASELRMLAKGSAGVRTLSHRQWRQGWIIAQLDVLESARRELVAELEQAVASHPYTSIIESLPIKSPIWTATLIGVIGDVHRFNTFREFKAYMGWYPQTKSSGTSANSSRLAIKGVRSGRRVFGQMAMLLLTPNIRETPFRVSYRRWTDRSMPGAAAVGHLAGKLCGVIYGMLKTMTPYDEAKHRRELGLIAVLDHAATIEAQLDLVDTLDEQLMDTQDPSGNGGVAKTSPA
jgi:transposase